MSLCRIVAISSCIIATAAVAAAQGTFEFQPASQTTVVERRYPGGDLAPSRQLQTITSSGNRQLVVETFQQPDLDGRLAPTREVVTQRIVARPNVVQTRRDEFWFAGSRRTLSDTTESLEETFANGDSTIVHSTSAPDLNGRLRVMSRQIVETRTVSAGVRETRVTLMLPDLDGILRAVEHSESVERIVSPDLAVQQETQFIRDVNGRWQRIEVASGEARGRTNEAGTNELTVHRVDINGQLIPWQKIVTHHPGWNAPEELVLEIYTPYADGSTRLAMSERIRQTTMVTSGGDRSGVEEVESRNAAAPQEPLRVTRRSLTTTRQTGTDRSVTTRQDFERDVNRRLRLVVISETTEETSR